MSTIDIPRLIAAELQLKNEQIESVITLLGEGATIPFIARYRKEKTGGLDEDVLRDVEDKLNYLRMLEDRKETILKSIEEQGKLTDELKAKIEECTALRELEDLYLPYKPKRKTRATVAKAKGLEPLAVFILDNPRFDGNLEDKLKEFVDEEKGVANIEEALQGAKDIIAEMISEDAEVRKELREYVSYDTAVKSEKTKDAVSKSTDNLKLKDKEKRDVYKTYYDFEVDIKRIKPYQILALNRGEKEKFLKVSFVFNEEDALDLINDKFFNYDTSIFEEILHDCVRDSFKRLLYPSIEREVRSALTEEADLHAIEVFAENLRSLLLQPPIAGKIILGIDPGFASGCKAAVIDESGDYIEGTTIYPHPPQQKPEAAKKTLLKLIEKYNVDIIAIGNGTASRETEVLVANMINDNRLNCKYIIVSEAGASVYSASAVAKKEFPDLEASQRGNISIARRLLDPLAELVKIDPKSIGVGLYQHDVDQKLLAKKLDDVVISCVNYVGVDVNTASAPLLAYVSGLNNRLANNIVKYRRENGRFKNRKEFIKVSGIGEKAFEQCAGFMKIPGSENAFDNTFIHPESYDSADKFLDLLNADKNDLTTVSLVIDHFLAKREIEDVAENLDVGTPTLTDIIENLKKPGRDPREDLPKPILRGDVLKMEDLEEGMMLKGTVRNVVDFGAFVDIGLKTDGLLHISKMKKGFVKDPLEIVKAGDIIEVSVVEIDIERQRIALSLIG